MISNRFVRGALLFLFLLGISVPGTAYAARCGHLLLQAAGAIVASALVVSGAHFAIQSHQSNHPLLLKAHEADDFRENKRVNPTPAIQDGQDYVSPLTGRVLTFETIEALGTARTVGDMTLFARALGIRLVVFNPRETVPDPQLKNLHEEFRRNTVLRSANADGRPLATLFLPPEMGLPLLGVSPGQRPFSGEPVLMVNSHYENKNTWRMALQHEFLHHLLGNLNDRAGHGRDQYREEHLLTGALKQGVNLDSSEGRFVADANIRRWNSDLQLHGGMMLDEWDVLLIQFGYANSLGNEEMQSMVLLESLLGHLELAKEKLAPMENDQLLQHSLEDHALLSEGSRTRLMELHEMRSRLYRAMQGAYAAVLQDPRYPVLVQKARAMAPGAKKPDFFVH